MRFRDQRAQTLEEAQAAEANCPQAPRALKFIDCPHGCGLRYLAGGQKLNTDQFWRYGPWRMRVHLIGNPGGRRPCHRPLFDGPVQLHQPTEETN